MVTAAGGAHHSDVDCPLCFAVGHTPDDAGAESAYYQESQHLCRKHGSRLTAGTQGVERQVAPATGAGSSRVTTPPLSLADPPAAAGLEGGVAAQQITSEPSSRDSTPSVVAKLQTGMPQLEAMSDFVASVDRPGPVSLAGASARVSAPCPTDRAFSRKQRRRRRGRMTPSSPPDTVGKEGGVNSRGAQTLSEQRDAMNRAATVEAGSELRQTALEEDTAAATLPATLDRGSTVPVPYSDAVRPPNRQVLTGENMDTVARGRAGSGLPGRPVGVHTPGPERSAGCGRRCSGGAVCNVPHQDTLP